MRHILDIAKDLPHDYTTLTGEEVSTDPDGYERAYSDELTLRFEADGLALFIGTEYGVTMPDGADPDVDEGVHEIIGYNWVIWNAETDPRDQDAPYRVDGTMSEEEAIATIADFMVRAS